MADRVDICIIPNCGASVRYYHLQVCGACYAGLSRWRGRAAAHKREHLARCERLVSRTQFVIENPRHHPQERK